MSLTSYSFNYDKNPQAFYKLIKTGGSVSQCRSPHGFLTELFIYCSYIYCSPQKIHSLQSSKSKQVAAHSYCCRLGTPFKKLCLRLSVLPTKVAKLCLSTARLYQELSHSFQVAVKAFDCLLDSAL